MGQKVKMLEWIKKWLRYWSQSVLVGEKADLGDKQSQKLNEIRDRIYSFVHCSSQNWEDRKKMLQSNESHFCKKKKARK